MNGDGFAPHFLIDRLSGYGLLAWTKHGRLAKRRERDFDQFLVDFAIQKGFSPGGGRNIRLGRFRKIAFISELVDGVDTFEFGVLDPMALGIKDWTVKIGRPIIGQMITLSQLNIFRDVSDGNDFDPQLQIMRKRTVDAHANDVARKIIIHQTSRIADIPRIDFPASHIAADIQSLLIYVTPKRPIGQFGAGTNEVFSNVCRKISQIEPESGVAFFFRPCKCSDYPYGAPCDPN